MPLAKLTDSLLAAKSKGAYIDNDKAASWQCRFANTLSWKT